MLQDGEQDENIRQVQTAVRWAWLYVFMPLLFCLIGTGIDFSTETSSTISDACAIVFSGVCAAPVMSSCETLRCNALLHMTATAKANIIHPRHTCIRTCKTHI